MAIVYLSLGSNKGNRAEYLCNALQRLLSFCHFRTLSNIYETKSWGFEGSDFLNLVCCLETDLPAEELLIQLRKTEELSGREKNFNEGYSDRVIDIDILFYDSLVYVSKSLSIPHPLFHLRMFCILPMLDIAPDFIHPVLNLTISEIHDKQTSFGGRNKISLFLKSEQFRLKHPL